MVKRIEDRHAAAGGGHHGTPARASKLGDSSQGEGSQAVQKGSSEEGGKDAGTPVGGQLSVHAMIYRKRIADTSICRTRVEILSGKAWRSEAGGVLYC